MPSLERRTPQGHYVRPSEDWGKLIGDVPSATAILDRFLHHATVIPITGRSYRLRHAADSNGVDHDDPKPANAPAGSKSKKKTQSAATEAAVTCES